MPGTASSCGATPVGTVVTYGYDLAGRLTGVSDNSSTITVITPPSSTTTTYGATYSYDALNRLTGTTFGDVASATSPTAASVEFTHTYNAVNQRVSQAASDNSWIEYPAASASTTTYTSNALNQYTAVGSASPTYSANGNLLTDGTLTLGYDAENRLVSASKTGTTASYTYDGRGRRKTRTVNGTTTITITDADNREVLEYSGSSGAILRWYVYGLGPNDLLAQVEGGGTRYTPVPDLLGSIVASLNASTGALTKYAYRPYGSSASPPGQFGFTGQRIDSETGLYYYRARHYSAAMGRFLQADPIGFDGGALLYAYVGNDPLNGVDFNGLWQLTIAVFWGWGGSVTVGSNSGQWNVGGYVGVGVGATFNLQLTPSAATEPGWQPSVKAGAAAEIISELGLGGSVTLPLSAPGVATSITVELSGGIGPYYRSSEYTFDQAGRLTSKATSGGLGFDIGAYWKVGASYYSNVEQHK